MTKHVKRFNQIDKETKVPNLIYAYVKKIIQNKCKLSPLKKRLAGISTKGIHISINHKFEVHIKNEDYTYLPK